jgi:hypothetical protein
MITLHSILLILGLVVLVAAAFELAVPHVNLEALGLALALFGILVRGERRT